MSKLVLLRRRDTSPRPETRLGAQCYPRRLQETVSRGSRGAGEL